VERRRAICIDPFGEVDLVRSYGESSKGYGYNTEKGQPYLLSYAFTSGDIAYVDVYTLEGDFLERTQENRFNYE
jgi:hypothetical protein